MMKFFGSKGNSPNLKKTHNNNKKEEDNEINKLLTELDNIFLEYIEIMSEFKELREALILRWRSEQ